MYVTISTALIKLIFFVLGQEWNADLLISEGANVNAVDNDRKSVLYWAIENGIAINFVKKMTWLATQSVLYKKILQTQMRF